MCPSTDATAEERKFADEVLHKLLHHIDVMNGSGDGPYLVSHAWTDGAMMYLVYTQPSHDITWGLVRDTRESLIATGPWSDADDAARYYYLLDIQEGCATSWPDDPSAILWCGFPVEDDLPERPSDIPDEHRHTPAPIPAAVEREQRVVNEPRRYADPF